MSRKSQDQLPGDPIASLPDATEVLIAGAGPSGCAAALMCDSLGIGFVVADPSGVGGWLWDIPNPHNVGVAVNSVPRRLQETARLRGTRPLPADRGVE